jgi:hypothetical protein
MFIKPVCPSVRMYKNDCYRTEFRELSYLRFYSKACRYNPLLVKLYDSDNPHEDSHTLIVSHQDWCSLISVVSDVGVQAEGSFYNTEYSHCEV